MATCVKQYPGLSSQAKMLPNLKCVPIYTHIKHFRIWLLNSGLTELTCDEVEFIFKRRMRCCLNLNTGIRIHNNVGKQLYSRTCPVKKNIEYSYIILEEILNVSFLREFRQIKMLKV